ncbi:MAG: glycoside hydrolase family 65 protein, partial [Cytophagaceae bacterium]|nr:glycoside hydrolase family 65 protein [Cytophagaceae bacterium]
MQQYIEHDEWKIIEEGFTPEYQEASESIFSLGNGRMGQRANFEEQYSGESLRGSYIAGVYYPDKTKVGWWKNGYPEYFAKVLNSPNWIGIDVEVDGVALDLYKANVESFRRELDMKRGVLSRTFTATLKNGKQIKVATERFLSMDDPECGAIRYAVTPLNFSGRLALIPYIDGGVANRDSNYDETFWNIIETRSVAEEAWLLSQTKKLDFRVSFAMQWTLNKIGYSVTATSDMLKCENRIETDCFKDETVSLEKYAAVCSSLNHVPEQLVEAARKKVALARSAGFDTMLQKHVKRWDDIWKQSDIRIKGDVAAQQGIHFNIFQLNQTYTGDDDRLNIGPKGFTGEKYGGSTYWDTEAYCIPFFIATAPQHVTRNLLMYRYRHLAKAIENAEKLGFTGGAALYPMVTMNGEECHNEWEITFEEIHRNGAIAFAIYNYVRHTGNEHYLDEYGIEVLIGISRFWAQRATFSKEKNKYVILGVTGPNEYENNVNNNWYTNKIAVWTLKYTLETLERIKKTNPLKYDAVVAKTTFNFRDETVRWADIILNMHFPHYHKAGIFLQQDGYLDKEQLTVNNLPLAQRPINQHWSWDRILRSCFIKQADTLQGVYLFEDEFDTESISRHFDFYEPRTVHEST